MPYFYLYFADGTVLFVATALLMAGIGLSFLRQRLLSSALFLIGLPLLMTGYPPIGTAARVGVLILTVVSALAVYRRDVPAPFRIMIALGAAAALMAMASYHYPERFATPPPEKLVVIGDSLSSVPKQAWPHYLAKRTNRTTLNRSRPGLRTERAVRLAKRPVDGRCTMLLFVGGNDLLGDTPLAEFRSAWSDLVAAASDQCESVRAVGLPTLPGAAGYARIQRSINQQRRIDTLPPSVFLSVYSEPGARSADGLHLTAKGQRLLSQQFERHLGLAK